MPPSTRDVATGLDPWPTKRPVYVVMEYDPTRDMLYAVGTGGEGRLVKLGPPGLLTSVLSYGTLTSLVKGKASEEEPPAESSRCRTDHPVWQQFAWEICPKHNVGHASIFQCGLCRMEREEVTNTMTNAQILTREIKLGTFNGAESVNSIAKKMGWGWHRTRNTLREIGCLI